jgi:uncharacterized protein (DUF2147 family)
MCRGTGACDYEGIERLAAHSGRTYSGVITLQGPNALNVKGCMLGFCRAETWTKVR